VPLSCGTKSFFFDVRLTKAKIVLKLYIFLCNHCFTAFSGWTLLVGWTLELASFLRSQPGM